ncbi:MAG: enoyl-CoA hydratase [Cellvibrionaceae bacterium]|mgnify:CR=1 FL=1|nr:enoyl-CoA hydratase [Cellvibrionaceae bacterium]|tara:strand:- start:926 stop:1714 length:789 start_codon:yes stop_codon:yes gene_type:complete
MNYEFVNVDRDAGVETISLNRPDVRNSLNRQLRKELRVALEQSMANENIRVVVLTGEGSVFCAGADLSEKIDDNGEVDYLAATVRAEYNSIIEIITRGSKPVICAVAGTAAGFAGALVLACDLVVMTEDAEIYSAFSGIALVPDGGFHYFLSKALGAQKAYEIIAFCQRLDARRCENLGLANRVVSSDELREAAMAFAVQLSRLAPLSLCHSKQLLREAATEELMVVADKEAMFQEKNLRSKDHQEGVSAFFEKRKANFIGC